MNKEKPKQTEKESEERLCTLYLQNNQNSYYLTKDGIEKKDGIWETLFIIYLSFPQWAPTNKIRKKETVDNKIMPLISNQKPSTLDLRMVEEEDLRLT